MKESSQHGLVHLCVQRGEGSSGRCFLAVLGPLSRRPVIPRSALRLCQGNLFICSSFRSAPGPFCIYRPVSVRGAGLPLLSGRRPGERGPEAGAHRGLRRDDGAQVVGRRTVSIWLCVGEQRWLVTCLIQKCTKPEPS